MSNVKNEDGFDNVFYDRYSEVVNYPCVGEVWEEAKVICLTDSEAHIGLFPQSDIIIMYDRETEMPMIITERIFRKNYTFWQWRTKQSYLRKKLRVVRQELGFKISISFAIDYIDYTHYKEEYHLWAVKQIQR